MNSVRSRNLSLKYLRFTPSGYNNSSPSGYKLALSKEAHFLSDWIKSYWNCYVNIIETWTPVLIYFARDAYQIKTTRVTVISCRIQNLAYFRGFVFLLLKVPYFLSYLKGHPVCISFYLSIYLYIYLCFYLAIYLIIYLTLFHIHLLLFWHLTNSC